MGIMVVRECDPNARVHFVPKGPSAFLTTQTAALGACRVSGGLAAACPESCPFSLHAGRGHCAANRASLRWIQDATWAELANPFPVNQDTLAGLQARHLQRCISCGFGLGGLGYKAANAPKNTKTLEANNPQNPASKTLKNLNIPNPKP